MATELDLRRKIETLEQALAERTRERDEALERLHYWERGANKQWLTARDVAGRLDISEHTARRLMKAEMQGVTIGGLHKVQAADFETWLDAHRWSAFRLRVEADQRGWNR